MPQPLILVLYNRPILPGDHPDAESERSVVDVAEKVAAILRQGGYRSALLGLREDPRQLIDELRRLKPAAVFNLHEGSSDNGETEVYVAGILEWLGVPFTGSPSQTLSVARSKPLAKALMIGTGLPTPDSFVVERLPLSCGPRDWPVIVKPALQDASLGVDQESVVTNLRQLERRVAYVLQEYGPPVLVEEFIDGRELNIALVEDPELRCLPPSEILFEQGPNAWPILTYAGKWRTDSDEFIKTPPRCPADISPRLAERLNGLAQEAYRLLRCRDYARVDFRIRPSGKPYILEVNPNPDISPAAGFPCCLAVDGSTLAEFILRLIRSALSRRSAVANGVQAGNMDADKVLSARTAKG
jgi:D-alanine-D-alanine ligase